MVTKDTEPAPVSTVAEREVVRPDDRLRKRWIAFSERDRARGQAWEDSG